MNFEEYTVEDFVCDESFQNFCRGHDFNDVTFWSNWIENHPHKKDEVRRAIQIFDLLSVQQRFLHRDFNSLQQATRAKLNLEEEIFRIDTSQKAKRSGSGKLIRLARSGAAALVILAVAYFAYFGIGNSNGPNDMQSIRYTTVSTGQNFTPSDRKTIFLPDSSVVVLATNSEIILDPQFGPGNRKATINGEAYFDIHHDPDNPFYLDCSEMQIKVLGTKFTVKNFPQSDSIDATLIDGEIEISYPGQNEEMKSVVLLPNQHFSFKRNTTTKIEAPVNSDLREVALLEDRDDIEMPQITRWVRKSLSFENEDFGTIADTLESWYGVTIRFDNENVKNYRYTGTFEDENVRTILEVLQESYPFGMEAEGNNIRVYK